MCQVLGAFGLLDFTCYCPFSLGGRFEKFEPFIYLIFKFFSGRGKPRILSQCIRGHDCTLVLTSTFNCLTTTNIVPYKNVSP
jgi:hypothetical protein